MQAGSSLVTSTQHVCLVWPQAVFKITEVHENTHASVGNLREASLLWPGCHQETAVVGGGGHEQAGAPPTATPSSCLLGSHPAPRGLWGLSLEEGGHGPQHSWQA